MLNLPYLKYTHLAGNPLNSSVDAKLQAICQSLESSGKNNVNIESKPEPVVSLLTVETEESCSSSSVVTGATSFPVSEIESLDFNEVSWEDAEDFVLRKYPTYEID
ncbi:ethylene-responsive transcription factor RAP2-4-like [Asparagus officinalis]|uniref:ethylene-responsive transcription factor RAP2-4-like n=1 Tax=Asparagus officinalis TaxID=4686 RepID=UPI00098E014A|nr:ethylene-responsive transcription factor RAP2-4-like [Asparagus officinalis]